MPLKARIGRAAHATAQTARSAQPVRTCGTFQALERGKYRQVVCPDRPVIQVVTGRAGAISAPLLGITAWPPCTHTREIEFFSTSFNGLRTR